MRIISVTLHAIFTKAIEEHKASVSGKHMKKIHGVAFTNPNKMFSVLEKCRGKLDCKRKLNTQSDSIRAIVFINICTSRIVKSNTNNNETIISNVLYHICFQLISRSLYLIMMTSKRHGFVSINIHHKMFYYYFSRKYSRQLALILYLAINAVWLKKV